MDYVISQESYDSIIENIHRIKDDINRTINLHQRVGDVGNIKYEIKCKEILKKLNLLQNQIILSAEETIDGDINTAAVTGFNLKQAKDCKKKMKMRIIPSELKRGIKIEMEHTKDPKLSKQIALDHLKESPLYYFYLDKIEPLMPKAAFNLKRSIKKIY